MMMVRLVCQVNFPMKRVGTGAQVYKLAKKGGRGLVLTKRGS